MKKLIVDDAFCQGFAMCEALAPQLFRLDEQSIAIVLKQPETPDEIAAAEESVRRCPRKAIRFEEA